jgi:polysaccharide transporter, PST family
MKDKLLTPPHEGSLRSRLGKGAAWTGGGQIARTGTQILSVIILSRILTPNDFGVVAMCSPVLAFVLLFQDLGLGQATIQREMLTHQDVNFLFWINAAVSVALAVILILIAPIMGAFYGEPKVASLTAAMSLQILVYGVSAQHNAVLVRRMEFSTLAVISAAGGVAGLAVSTIAALYSRSYWAIFAGTMATTLVVSSATCYCSGWRPSRPRVSDRAGPLLNFGAGLTGFNLLNFFGRNLDGVLIGRYWGVIELGYYDRANKLLLLPLNQVMNPLSRIMIPALSRTVSNPEQYRSAYLKTLSLVLFIVLPGIAFVTATADLIIPLVLGAQWSASAKIFQALGCAGLLQAANNSTGWLFISQGRSGDMMRWGVVSTSTIILAFLIGLPYGATGVAFAYAIGEYLRTLPLWFYIGRRGPVSAKDLITSLGPFIVAAHIALLATWLVHTMTPGGSLATLLISAGVCGLTHIAVVLMFPSSRSAIKELVLMLKIRASQIT